MSAAKKQGTRGKIGFFQSVKTKLVLIIVAIMAIPLAVSVVMSYYSLNDEAVSNMHAMNDAQINIVQHDFNGAQRSSKFRFSQEDP